MKEGNTMKKGYSRLCLKERWASFGICLIAGIVAVAVAVFFFIKNQRMIGTGACLAAVILLLISCYIFQMNMRRKKIKKEYSFEFDRELFAKERSCPKCGASIGSNVCYCPKCGTKFY